MCFGGMVEGDPDGHIPESLEVYADEPSRVPYGRRIHTTVTLSQLSDNNA